MLVLQEAGGVEALSHNRHRLGFLILKAGGNEVPPKSRYPREGSPEPHSSRGGHGYSMEPLHGLILIRSLDGT